jgi:hypothetical protein
MTTKVPLKSLRITAFRGASVAFALPFEKDRNLTLVYGENGTGKTTICDAFEFLAYERVSSLDGYGLGKSLEKYWPTAGKNPSDLSVALETSAGTCFGKFTNKKVEIAPLTLRPKIELLRRQQVLRLIQAEPAKRYEEIKRFIDIGAFEASEEALSRQSKNVAEERSRAQQAEGQSLQELQGFYEAAGSPAGLNPVTWAEQKLAGSATNFDNDIAAIGKLRSVYDAFKGFPERTKSCQAAVIAATNALAQASTALATTATAVTEGNADILAVLEAGSRYLHVHSDAAECPLCRSNANAEGLAKDIASRLAKLGALRTATATSQKYTMSLTTAQNAVTQLDADYAKAVAAYSTAMGGHAWKAEVELFANAPPADVPSLAAWLVASDAIAQTWPAVEAAWRDEKKFTATLKAASERYKANLSTRTESEALIPKLEEALKHCIEQRQAFTNKIIGGIAQDIGKLYEKVHPGEGLDVIALPLDPKKRASIELEASFSGQDVPPQAYFSQSHLDTLGLCVFLALAARDRPDATILLLDDVLGSVDEPHVERVVGMIYEVSVNFRHTIVTTHYRPWREKFRWGVLKPDQLCQFVELKQWTLDEGVALAGSIPEVVRLRALLADPNPDVQAVCGKAGVILEALLDFLTLKYGCAVPRRVGGAYVLSDLLGAVNGKLLAALKSETLDHSVSGAPVVTVTELKPILDEIAKLAQARNVMGAHFNAVAFDLYPIDGLKFAKLVEQLSSTLICPDFGWPNKDKSGSYWNNGGDTRRLHPLKKPA